MNIQVIIPHLEVGGAERVALITADLFIAFGYQVYLTTAKKSNRDYQISEKLIHKELDIDSYNSMAGFIKEYGIDLVITHCHWSLNHAISLGRLSREGIKVIQTEHNNFFYPVYHALFMGEVSMLNLYHYRFDSYQHFSAVVVLNDFNRLLFSRYLDNVVTIRNPLSYVSEKVSDCSSSRVLSVSTFHRRSKRMDLLMQVFSALKLQRPEVELAAVGPADPGTVEKYLQDAGLAAEDVFLPGVVNPIEPEYLKSGIFVMTSEIEGQPMVLLEAAMHGVPQVVFDTAGINEQVIDGETGYVLPFGDIKGMVEKIIKLIDAPDLRRRLGANARQYVVKNFSLNNAEGNWLDLINKVTRDEQVVCESPALGETSVNRIEKEFEYWLGKISKNTTRPKVSVIIPVYKSERNLARCLESVFRQNLYEMEVIVVDDASPGEVEEIVENYLKVDTRLRFVRQKKNSGVYQARLTGAEHARGEYLLHVDSDDYIHPDMTSVLYSKAVGGSYEIVECNAMELMLDGYQRQFCEQYTHESLFGHELKEYFFTGKIKHVLWNKLIRRDVWELSTKQRTVDRHLNITDDLLACAYVFSAANSYCYINYGLYYYARREDSLGLTSHEDSNRKQIGDLLYVLKRLISEKEFEITQSPSRLEHLVASFSKDIKWYTKNQKNINDVSKNELIKFDDVDLLVSVLNITQQYSERDIWHLKKDVRMLEGKMNSIQNSRSWKITAPLRWTYSRFLHMYRVIRAERT